VNLGLSGKRALVTASSRGIGRAAAERLVAEGCTVVLNARSEAQLAKSAAELAGKGGQVIAKIADLGDEAALNTMLSEVLDELGGIDILVSNTGGPPTMPVLDPTLDDWRSAFQTVVQPAVALVRRLAPGMRERGWGRIIFVTSTWVKQPAPGGVLSAAARSAVSALAKQLAIELGPDGVLVNQVMPGPTWTDRSKQIVASLAASRGVDEEVFEQQVTGAMPLRRYGQPEEVGDLIAFLASDRASFLTGAAIAADGGQIRTVL
jgi:3-oxoacyl-[acyl-carrier protein] reductase